jgi:D-glycero-D-manno-heptose 1,7-bisphosphate phosphatase
MRSRALFLDRDGTLVHPVHYPSRPEELRLYANLGPALRELQEMGFLLVVITNQSGVARGYFAESDLQCMHAFLRAELLTMGVRLSGIYHCPHHPAGIVPELTMDCECRKPRPGLLLQAAADLHIDLANSWFVGDILDDVEAGNLAGCRTVLVDLGTEAAPEQAVRQPTFVARNTLHALQIVSTIETICSSVELSTCAAEMTQRPIELFYQPAAWQKAMRQSTKEISGVSYG